MADSELEAILATVDDRDFEYDDWNDACMGIKKLASEWRDIGTALGIDHHKLDEIAGNNHHKASDCLSDVLKDWIGQNYNTGKYGVPSWKTLCKALSKVADKKFVKDLAKAHGGVVPSGGASGGSSSASAEATPSNEEKLLSEQPKMGEFNLLKYKSKDGKKKRLNILSRASHRWRDIANRLFDDTHLITNLTQKHRDDSTECLRQLFMDFLSKHLANDYTRDWNGIIEMFEDLEEEALAEEIKEAVLNKV